MTSNDQPDQPGLDDAFRDRLDRATLDGPLALDLPRALREGRVRRRRRTLAVGGAAAGVAALAVVGALAAQAGGSHRPASQGFADTASSPTSSPSGTPSTPATTPSESSAPATPASDGASSGDYVAGTDTDEKMAAAIADDIPSLGRPTDVYPSDVHHAGPIADSEWPQATEWQATYDVGGGETLLVIMTYPEAGADTPKPGASTQHFDSGGRTYYGSYFTRSDGFTVNSFDSAPDGDALTLDKGELAAVSADPRLTFPAPKN